MGPDGTAPEMCFNLDHTQRSQRLPLNGRQICLQQTQTAGITFPHPMILLFVRFLHHSAPTQRRRKHFLENYASYSGFYIGFSSKGR